MLFSPSRVVIAVLLATMSVNAAENGVNEAGKTGVDMAKAAGGLLLSGVAKYATDELSQKEGVKNFSQKVGIDTQDVGNVISISGGMLSLSLIANDDTAKGLRELSWRAPIAAAVAGCVFTRTFQNIASHVPVIGSAVKCSNEQCTGVCDKCKLTKATLAIGVYRAVDVGLQLLIGKWAPKENK